ncbi:MAG: hypothetical protein ACI81P_000962, partial [Neolewinella sp.]
FVVRAKRNKSLWLCHRLITNQPSSVGWNPRLRLAEDGLAGGRQAGVAGYHVRCRKSFER